MFRIYSIMFHMKSGKRWKNKNLNHFDCKNFRRNVLFILIKVI